MFTYPAKVLISKVHIKTFSYPMFVYHIKVLIPNACKSNKNSHIQVVYPIKHFISNVCIYPVNGVLSSFCFSS